jgi:hypothetical protein
VERYRTYFENKRHEFEKFLKINFIEFGVVLLPSKWFLTRNAEVEIPTGGKGPLDCYIVSSFSATTVI